MTRIPLDEDEKLLVEWARIVANEFGLIEWTVEWGRGKQLVDCDGRRVMVDIRPHYPRSCDPRFTIAETIARAVSESKVVDSNARQVFLDILNRYTVMKPIVRSD